MAAATPDFQTTYRAIPSIRSREFLPALKEVLEVLTGQRGNELDRAVSLRDLASSPVVKYLNNQEISITRPDEGVQGQTRIPDAPTNLILQSGDDSDRISAFNIALSWTLHADDDDISATEIWMATSNDRSAAEKVGIVTYPNNEYTYINPKPNIDHYFWIRVIDWAGNYSEWEPSGAASGFAVQADTSIQETIDRVLRALKGDSPATYGAGTTYYTDDRVKYVCDDGTTRTYIAVGNDFSGQAPETGTPPETNFAYWNRSGILNIGEVDGEGVVGIDGNMVCDGTIVTRNLDAECITADVIAAGAIEAAAISVGAVDWSSHISGTEKPADYADVTPDLPPSENLEVFLPLDEGTGSVVADISGEGHAFTLYNTPAWVKGVSGNALDFTGASHEYGLSDANISVSADCTVCGWVKPESFGGGGVFGTFYYNAGSDGHGFSVIPQAASLKVTVGRTGASYTFNNFACTINTAEWAFLAVTYNDTTNIFTAYLNGEQVDNTWNQAVVWSGEKFCFGRWAVDYGGYYFNGIIDEMRLYKQCLTANQVKALYLNPSGLVDHSMDAVVEGDVYGKMPKGWKHASDVTKIDGGNVYTNTILATAINTSTLSAIVADLGTITAGIAQSSDGKLKIDFTNKWIKVWDAQGTPQLRVHIGYIS